MQKTDKKDNAKTPWGKERRKGMSVLFEPHKAFPLCALIF
jgi:hypothetical protein